MCVEHSPQSGAQVPLPCHWLGLLAIAFITWNYSQRYNCIEARATKARNAVSYFSNFRANRLFSLSLARYYKRLQSLLTVHTSWQVAGAGLAIVLVTCWPRTSCFSRHDGLIYWLLLVVVLCWITQGYTFTYLLDKFMVRTLRKQLLYHLEGLL